MHIMHIIVCPATFLVLRCALVFFECLTTMTRLTRDRCAMPTTSGTSGNITNVGLLLDPPGLSGPPTAGSRPHNPWTSVVRRPQGSRCCARRLGRRPMYVVALGGRSSQEPWDRRPCQPGPQGCIPMLHNPYYNLRRSCGAAPQRLARCVSPGVPAAVAHRPPQRHQLGPFPQARG